MTTERVDPVEPVEPPASVALDAAPDTLESELAPAVPPAPAAPIKPPRVWTVFVAFIGLGVMQISFSVPLAMAAMTRTDGNIKSAFASPPVLATAIWLSVTALSLIVLVAATGPWRARLSLPSLRASPIDVAAAVIGTLAIGAVTSTTARLLGIYEESTLQAFRDAFMNAGPVSMTFLTVGVVAAALCEELFYRGFAQTRLALRFGPVVAVIVASTMFGLSHMDLAQGAFAFGFGCFLGIVAVRTRSIAIGVYAHVINNFIAAVSTKLMPGDDTDDTPLLTIACGTVAFIAAAVILWVRTRDTPERREAPPPLMHDDATLERWGVQRRRRIVALSIGSVLLCFFAVVVGIVVAAAGTLGKGAVDPASAIVIGERAGAFAMAHDDRACIDEALTLPTSEAVLFARTCLPRARRSVPDLCEGVPAQSSFREVTRWYESECAALGQTNNTFQCSMVLGALSAHCAAR